MTEASPPTWVRKRDGRLVPFDADRISRALFAATEERGKPDAFLSRELTDSVVHFLSQAVEGETPTTERIAEVVAQVVREMGQPELSRAFRDFTSKKDRVTPSSRSLASVLADAARGYTLQAVYQRDLAAAVEAGLLTITGLETPGELAGCVLGPPLTFTGDLLADIEQARRFAGQYVAIEGVEHLSTLSPAETANVIARALRLTGLQGVVNLNCAAPPAWAVTRGDGPLFAVTPAKEERPSQEAYLRAFMQGGAAQVRIDWHVSERWEQLGFVVEHALMRSPFSRSSEMSADADALISDERLNGGTQPLTFVFDRPRRPIALAEGIDRHHPATLLSVGINLVTLLNQPGMLTDPDRYCQRLGSLARLALSAAVRKRDYIRQQAKQRGVDVSSGFLLDRARFVVVPLGLDEVVTQFTGWSLASGGSSLELAKKITTRLAEVLHQDGRGAQMDVCLDGPTTFTLEGEPIAGVTCFDQTASLRSQLRACGALHAITGTGTLALYLPDDTTAEQLVESLEWAWRHTDVVRVRLLRPTPKQGQLFTQQE
jgi:hypothetical protein